MSIDIHHRICFSKWLQFVTYDQLLIYIERQPENGLSSCLPFKKEINIKLCKTEILGRYCILCHYKNQNQSEVSKNS